MRFLNVLKSTHHANSLLRLKIFLFLLMAFSVARAQTVLRGKVFDEISLQPVSDVQITALPATNPNFIQDITMADGAFEVASMERFDSLRFVVAGYKIKTLAVGQNDNFIFVPLEPRVAELNEVVLSGFFSGRKVRDQGGSVSVISKEDLKRDAPLIIAPSLNRIPGVYMQSGAYNTNRISIRGIGARTLFGTNKIRAYLNDIPLTSGDGETTIEDLDLSLIGRVEVLRGPASSIYGAGLGGTINLLTDKPEFASTRVSADVTAGSFGLRRNQVSFSHSNNHANLAINYNDTHSDGYRENNEYDRKSLTFMGQYYGGEKDLISVIVGIISVKAFIPSSIDSATFADEPTAAAFTWNKTKGFEDYDKAFFGISHTHSFNRELDHSLSLFGNFRNAWEPRPFNILGEQSQSVGLRNRLTLRRMTGKVPLKVQMGGEFFSEWYDWQTYENIAGEGELGGILSNNLEHRLYFNIFAESEWWFSPKVYLTLGANINQTQYTLTDRFTTDDTDLSGQYAFEPIVSPRISLVYKPQETITFHANISHGFSPPSLQETLTPDGQVNPEIQPETGWNFEIGSRGSIFSPRFNYDISIYSMRIRNLLVARRTGNDEFVGVNAGKTTHNGLEMALNYQWVETSDLTFGTTLTYALARYRFAEFEDGDRDYSGNQLTGTPPHMLNLIGELTTRPGFYGNINLLAVSSMPMRDDNSIYSQPYQVVNVKAGFAREVIPSLEIDIYGGVANLLDEKYAGMILINAGSFGNAAPRYYYPALPRNFFGGIKLSLKIK